MIGYAPAEQAIRAALGLPPAAGADDPPAWHDGGAPQTCWADPLNRAERTILAAKLARACKRLYHNRDFPLPSHVYGISCMEDAHRAGSYIAASAEMADLHLDVTERAAVAA